MGWQDAPLEQESSTASWKDAPIENAQQVNQPINEESPSLGKQALTFAANKVKDYANIGFGGIRGAGSIGSTILLPADMINQKLRGDDFLSMKDNEQRRNDMTMALKGMGADTDSNEFGLGKLGAEIAGTYDIGGVIGGGKLLGGTALGNSIKSGGMALDLPKAKNASEVIKQFLLRAGGGAVSGATTAGLVNPNDVKTGAIVGGALPVAAKVAGNVGTGIYNSIVPEASPKIIQLAEKAKNLGIDIPADRLTNSKHLNAVASTLNYVPFSGRAATEQKFESQLNKALSNTFGQNSDNVTMSLRKASNELGHKFDNTLKNNAVKVDAQFLDDLARTRQNAVDDLVGDELTRIDKQINNITSKLKDGVIDGQAAYNIKKTLDRIGNGKGNDAFHARELKKDLMNALDRSLGEKGAKDFAEVRKHYGTMLDLEGIAQNGAEGGISIARLANMKGIRNPELQDLADISAQFLKAREGQHGAAQRAVVGGLAGYAGGIPALVGGAAVGRGINTALNSELAKKAALGKLNSPKLTAEELKILTSTLPILANQ